MDASAIPTLQTPRLLLRAHRASDLDDAFALWSDPHVVRYITGKPSTRAECWTRIARYLGLWALLGFGFWAVRERASGAFVGDVGFMDVLREIEPPIAGTPEAGWVLAPAYHGRGYASEALGAALAWADRTLDAPRTVALVAPENAPSLRLARRMGYRLERTVDFAGSPAAVLARERLAPARP